MNKTMPKTIITTHDTYGDFEFGTSTYGRQLKLNVEAVKMLDGVVNPSTSLSGQIYIYAWYKSHIITAPKSFDEDLLTASEYEQGLLDLYTMFSERENFFRSSVSSDA